MAWLPGFQPYVPDSAVEEARDAQLLRTAHPLFHQWRIFDDGTTRCGLDGCTQVHGLPRVALRTPDRVFAVLNVVAKLPAAGPFDTIEQARDVKNSLRKSGGHTYTIVGPFDPDSWYEQACNVIPPGAGACARARGAVADRDAWSVMEEMLLRQ